MNQRRAVSAGSRGTAVLAACAAALLIVHAASAGKAARPGPASLGAGSAAGQPLGGGGVAAHLPRRPRHADERRARDLLDGRNVTSGGL